MTTELARVEGGGLTTVEASEAHALEALDAVEVVETPEQADELLRRITAYQQAVRLAKIGREQEARWGEVKLRAEAKMGELLPPPDEAQREAARRSANAQRGRGGLFQPVVPLGNNRRHARPDFFARRVAAVPERIREEYFKEAKEKGKTPTRAGLLRRAAPPKPKAQSKAQSKPKPTPGHSPIGMSPDADAVQRLREEVVFLLDRARSIDTQLDLGTPVIALHEDDRRALLAALDLANHTINQVKEQLWQE